MNYEIETEDDYRNAMNRFLEICVAPKNENEVKEMYLLMDLMGKYERENCSAN
ncbi:hypothetical protein OU798_12860 [Prolixibacteraceae bacterium Z1-6]|uniref:Uncharacterized protein n=1 Tax=Draconibacterium aestuarii TaxID=2998507 RepID=A0A9X3F9G1_9BACT|nr:hypothetical protein [Prolixibacteraceae bacterium Z1-6]